MINEWKYKLLSFWQARAIREKKILGIGAIVVGLVLFYSLIISPMLEASNNLSAELSAQDTLIAWMSPRADALKNRPVKNLQRLSQDALLSSIDQSIKNAGLVATLSQTTTGGIRVVLGSVNFDALINWLAATLQTQQLALLQMDAARLVSPADPGQVSASLTLALA
jgi:general secretion pathway protein M